MSGVERFSGKVVVVAGGSVGHGIATATVRRLVDEGASVVLGDRNDEGGKLVIDELAAEGRQVAFQRFDITDDASVASLIEVAVDRYGHLDGLFNVVNDASIGATEDILTVSLEAMARQFDTLVLGYLRCCRAAIPHMLEQGAGAIVQTSALAAQKGGAMPVLPGYQCAKAGVDALTRHIATRWGRAGIRCNSVSPGVTTTDSMKRGYLGGEVTVEHPALANVLTPLPGRPEDIAAAVAFLLSSDATYVNGEVLNVDGGWTVPQMSPLPKEGRS